MHLGGLVKKLKFILSACEHTAVGYEETKLPSHTTDVIENTKTHHILQTMPDEALQTQGKKVFGCDSKTYPQAFVKVHE